MGAFQKIIKSCKNVTDYASVMEKAVSVAKTHFALAIRSNRALCKKIVKAVDYLLDCLHECTACGWIGSKPRNSICPSNSCGKHINNVWVPSKTKKSGDFNKWMEYIQE